MKILVLSGGLSPEREVSLSSGSLIARALQEKGHRVFLADLYLGVVLDRSVPLSSLFSIDPIQLYTVSPEPPDLDRLAKESGQGNVLIGKNILALAKEADVVFLALHGASGENGQIQATLDTFGIPYYTGSGYIGSLLAMDKHLAKQLLRAGGIKTPNSLTVDPTVASPETVLASLSLPLVVKPVSCGSSVGISMVESVAELEKALLLASRYEDRVLVEEKIVGREFTEGILNGEVLPPVEIIPKSGFYDYHNKYQAGCTEEICPAELSQAELMKIQAATRSVFSLLSLRDYARIDYILSDSGELYCLEANSLPGMTPTSLLPQEAAAVGISYADLCERIALLAYQRR